MIVLQIIFGAFVSGLDAGKIYNTWPLMNNNFYPDDIVFKSLNDFLNFNDRESCSILSQIISLYSFFIILNLWDIYF